MILKYQIAFKLRPYGKEKSLFQIQQHATFNGQRLITSTGCQVNNLDAWDAENQCVKEGYKGPKGETTISINNTLRNCREQMVTAFRYFARSRIRNPRRNVSLKPRTFLKCTTSLSRKAGRKMLGQRRLMRRWRRCGETSRLSRRTLSSQT